MDNKFLSFLHKDGFWLMLHFLLRDALTLSFLAFAGLMTIEGLIPGFVSGHLNLAKVLFAISLLFFAFIAVRTVATASPIYQNQNTPTQQGAVSKWLLSGLLFWSSLLILNSLIKFPLYAIVIIFLLTAAIGKFLYDEFFESN